MAVPNQPCGLTNFDSRLVSKCPPNPNAIRSIVFSRDNLSVVNGASTEIQISMLPLFIPVQNAARTNISIPGSVVNVPYPVYKLDLAGLDTDEKVKFLGLLPTYGTSSVSSSLCSGATVTSSTTAFMEWAFIDDIEKGQLYDKPSLGPSGETSFDISAINKLEFSWGGYVNATGASGSLWVATDGGLLKWDNNDMKLWNTLNSNSPSDYINTLFVDSYNSLWVGSDNGLSKFSETEGFSKIWNTQNSEILSNNVISLEMYAPGQLAIGTDNGLSLYDTNANTWKNFNIYNTAALHHNQILDLAYENLIIFAATNGGVYAYEYSTNQWSVFNSSTPGWSAPDIVRCIEVYNGNVYAGTTGGLVIVPYMGGTASTIAAGASGPGSNYYMSSRSADIAGERKIYFGHDDAYSIYNVDTDTWSSENSLSFSYLGSGVKDLIVDNLSNSASETIYFGSQDPEKGLYRIFTGTGNFSIVPEDDKLTNILLSVPLNPNNTPLSTKIGTPGQWSQVLNSTNVDSSQLYANHQPFYFLFSKDMTTLSSSDFYSNTVISEGLEGSSNIVSGSWSSDLTGKVLTFMPDDPLTKASPYNLKVMQGSVAADGSNLKEKINVGFYTENIVPILGWKVMGKMLVHTGAENNYTQGLYLRNPQSTGVNITTLIGK